MRAALRSRRQFLLGSLTLASSGLLSGCGVLPAGMQRPAKVPRIGWIHNGGPGPNGAPGPIDTADEALLQRLGELGYVEGQTITIEHRYAEESRNGSRTSRPSSFGCRSISSSGRSRRSGRPGR